MIIVLCRHIFVYCFYLVVCYSCFAIAPIQSDEVTERFNRVIFKTADADPSDISFLEHISKNGNQLEQSTLCKLSFKSLRSGRKRTFSQAREYDYLFEIARSRPSVYFDHFGDIIDLYNATENNYHKLKLTSLLGTIGEQAREALPIIRQIVRDHTDPTKDSFLYARAVESRILISSSKEGVGELHEMANSENPQRRWMAAEILANLTLPINDSNPILKRLLADTDARVRVFAANASWRLRRISKVHAVDLLISEMNHPGKATPRRTPDFGEWVPSQKIIALKFISDIGELTNRQANELCQFFVKEDDFALHQLLYKLLLRLAPEPRHLSKRLEDMLSGVKPGSGKDYGTALASKLADNN